MFGNSILRSLSGKAAKHVSPVSCLKRLVILLFCLNVLPAQNTLKGVIIDEETLEYLPAANIQIKSTYRGTISNPEGKFFLELETLPATIIVSYIGYRTREIEIEKIPERWMSIALTPVILELLPITVTAEDPALEIIRKVIEKKKIWRKQLETYQADAYSRFVLENDSGIASIVETISQAFWHHEKGPREIVLAKRQTKNLRPEEMMIISSYTPNFYDDDIGIIGFQVIGVTHPDALDYYDFKLIKQRMRDDKIVYDIQVIPSSRLQPTFEGMISVLDEEFALIDVDLKPYKSIVFPWPIQEITMHYQQQLSNYGDIFWLPIDFRARGSFKIGIPGLQLPKIYFDQVTSFSNYQTNCVLPDTLYEKKAVLTDLHKSMNQDSVFQNTPMIVPLTQREDSAYQQLDSTKTLEKAFKPTGFLTRFMHEEEEVAKKDTSWTDIYLPGYRPSLWFNRVDGWHLGMHLDKTILGRIKPSVYFAYKTDLKRWGYGADLRLEIGKRRRLWLKGVYLKDSDTRYKSDSYPRLIASILPLIQLDDYFDYFWNESYSGELGYHIPGIDTRVILNYYDEQHRSLEKQTDFSFFGSNKKQRDNPAIEEGNFRLLKVTLNYGEDSYIPFGLAGQERINLQVEQSLGSRYKFTNYKLAVDWRFNTFLRRRIFPNALDVHMRAGTANGHLPLQHLNIIDANFKIFQPFGVLRTLTIRPYEGDQYLFVAWEHNFRSVPFELMNFTYPVKKGIEVILHGGHGRTWMSDQYYHDFIVPDKMQHEFGLSINKLFTLLRVDGSYRLDNNCYYFGLALSRFF
jgi:hypothetical protein